MAQDDDFSLDGFLPYLLSQAAEAVGRQFAATYRDRYGMLNTEWRVLAHLGQQDGLTAKQIGTLAQVHKTKVSRAVAALEAKRFVARTTTDRDRRSASLTLTRAGRAAYWDLTGIARAHDRRLEKTLGPDAYAGLVSQLRQLSGHGA